ncbi:ATP-binding protein [Hahella ganghwensis]|uniref:ATP-binding protein n=1 Tax=Hahella ganghwensis TaxID=286420 RepID=UPI00035C10B6|nr:ATP-binding protein [Hahella ganghwensis]
MTTPTPLHFDVSSGLKTVLGSELITDDEVAIFELVKNSFDARAPQVDIFFGNDEIIIADNGTGMTYDDIKKKWLFVAYSSKKEGNSENYREEIANRKYYAGSKGIGRFSSDRLGKIIILQTRHQSELQDPVHNLTIDWSLFDKNHQKRFDKVNVTYISNPKGFDIPDQLPRLNSGTVITIKHTRQVWNREKICRIKSALSKLINPFGSDADGFKIVIHAPAEEQADKDAQKRADEKELVLPPNDLANGEVGNFIFTTLQEKTTFIEVKIDPTTNQIESSLTDRGEVVYKIREPNTYPLLQDSNFHCLLFFLNTSAKMTFARRMGVPSVQFGSVFLFRNNFRVFPIGEEGDDWFKMDRRKQQGYARFLGTRDVIGRLDVYGSDEHFMEASSRNTGLIDSPAVDELQSCFRNLCLKRLERYVIPVTFVDKEDRLSENISRLLTDPAKARVASALAKLIDNEEIELLYYSQKLIGILSERSSKFEESLGSLKAIAEKSKDKTFLKNIEAAEKRFDELRRSEEAARKQADEERRAKEEARAKAEEERKAKEHEKKKALEAEELVTKVSAQLDEEKKRTLFLSSISTLGRV